MSQIFVAGPCEIHCGVGSAGALAFLGWSETGVRVSENPEWDDVPADLSGSRVPYDVQFMGTQAYVSFDLKVWGMDVYNRIAARWNPFGAGVPGFMPYGTIGELMIAEGAAFRLLVYPPYKDLKPGVMGTMRSYNFTKAWLAGPDDINPIGTRAMKIRMIFRAIMARDQFGNWLLYNDDATGKPAAA